jgi:DNA primase
MATNYQNDNVDVMQEATSLLGPPVAIDERRGWITYWCPSHPDEARAGTSGKPNFGINLDAGFYKCFRCGFQGPSLRHLARRLGKDWQPKTTDGAPPPKKRRESHIDQLDEALADSRSKLYTTPTMTYLRSRGVTPYTAMLYGLGYGNPTPFVGKDTQWAAGKSGLVIRDGTWLWAGSVIYADPLVRPCVLNARYIPESLLPAGTRPFEIEENHRTWGYRVTPLGAWRIQPGRTKIVVVVEGMFDMLIGAQTINDFNLYPEVVSIYTNGASPSHQMLEWFSDHDYQYVMIKDPDKAGDEWSDMIIPAIKQGAGRYSLLETPDKLDPDEAFLSGWWPSSI